MPPTGVRRRRGTLLSPTGMPSHASDVFPKIARKRQKDTEKKREKTCGARRSQAARVRIASTRKHVITWPSPKTWKTPKTHMKPRTSKKRETKKT